MTELSSVMPVNSYERVSTTNPNGSDEVELEEPLGEVYPAESDDLLNKEKTTNKGEKINDEQKSELRLYIEIAVPAILLSLCFYVQWTISASYAGKEIGVNALSGLSLANLSGNLLGRSLIFGMFSAFDTLASQAFGAKDYSEVGYLVQLSFVLGMVLNVIIVIIWWNMEPVLMLLGQPEIAVKNASLFLRIVSLMLPSDMVLELCKRFMQCQNIVYPFAMIQAVTVVFHIIFLNVFGSSLGLGFAGVAWAHVCSSYTSMTMALLYLRLRRPYHKGTWTPVDIKEAFNPKRVVEYLKLGIPGIFGMSEWWYWETICFFAGELGSVALASHSVAYQLIPLMFMPSLGLQCAVITRLGVLLAEGNVKLARKVGFYSLVTSMFFGVFNGLVAYLLRDYIIGAFTSDDDATELADSIWIWVCLFLVVDSLQSVACGILRGLGLQFSLSLSLIFCLWIVGVPASYVDVFVFNNGLKGLWQSMVGPYVLMNVVVSSIAFCQNWTRISDSIKAKHVKE